MRSEDGGEQERMAGDEVVIDTAGDPRRRALRRKLPCGRAAVLLVGERAHIVGVADLSVSGAYLTTRAPVSAGETHVLKVLLMPARVEVALRAEIVRVSLADHESLDHPRGVAVRIVELDERSRALVESFVTREPRRR